MSSDVLQSVLRQIQELLLERLEASSASAAGLAAVCAHVERLLEEAKLAHSEQKEDAQLERLLDKARRAVPLDSLAAAASSAARPTAGQVGGSGGQKAARSCSEVRAPSTSRSRAAGEMLLEPTGGDVGYPGVSAPGVSARSNNKNHNNKRSADVPEASGARPAVQASASSARGRGLTFNVKAWKNWREEQAAYHQLRSQEVELKQAAAAARASWRYKLGSTESSAHERDRLGQEGVASAEFLRACVLARLCRVAAKDLLPSPSAFFASTGILPQLLQAPAVEAGSSANSVHCTAAELERLFPLIALGTWLSRLAEESAAIVPAAALAAEMRLAETLPAHGLGTKPLPTDGEVKKPPV
ncbi:unnamed protein product, partial [Polarella glacialis]